MTGGGLTVLVCDSDHTASKTYARQPDGSIALVRDYDLGFKFRPNPHEFRDLHELAAWIEAIREGGNAVLVRGELDEAGRDAIERNPHHRIARRKNAKNDGFPAHLIEAARQWIMIDIDGYPLAPDADLRTDPALIIDEAIEALLPEAFHGAECFWQLSSSAGIVPGVLKVHLFYWLSQPQDNAYLRKWFQYYAPLVDIAPFNAVQPHFICDPKIKEGGVDPLPVRTGWGRGTASDVILPPLPDISDRTTTAHPSRGGAALEPFHIASIADGLSRIGDGDNRDGFHRPLLAVSMQYCIRCQKGGSRNDRKFIADLRKTIEEAPKRDGRDVANYLSEPYLRRIIDGAFCLVENALKSDEPDGDTPLSATKWPNGFGMVNAGLFFCEPTKDDAMPEWLCERFAIIGECEDGAGGEWGVVLAWQDAAKHCHTWIVPCDMFHREPHVISAHLHSHGLRCSYTKSAQGSLRRCLASVRPERRLQAVTTGGWHGTSCILPDGTVYGDADVILRPELQRADLSCAQAGTLAEWQNQVAKYAIGNSRLALFMSAAFAGSLLEIIAEPSGGLHLHGKSQTGKSTAGFVAASVSGKGARDGAVHQWRTTGNGLEGIASRCSDGCLVLDEISQSDAREAGDSIYQLANGQGKQRADRSGGARQRANWRIMFLSTGEVTLAQRMSDAGKRAMTGLEVRLVNIGGDAGAGLGIFDTLHDVAEPGLLADQLRDASARFYGTAGRAFVSRLVATRANDPDGFYGLVKAMRQQFITDHLPAGSDGQVRSVAGRFGVIAAAGELATEWGILPWELGEATQASATCFKAWLNDRGGIGAGEVQAAIRQVRAFFEQHGTSRFAEIRHGVAYPSSLSPQQKLNLDPPEDHIDEFRTLNRCGWRRRDGAGWEFLVLPEAWKSKVCYGIDPELAAKALDDRGLLKRDGKNLTCKVTIPENGRPRVYVVSGALLEGDGD
jgi:putative DNA primase/helicase